ncbi:DUF2752 domain-containing protein [Agriterribacter sp.]|uniref:DUF2752 domain-containing protein n=1 Tax=Agriterribacter sp. TaxID=2821509 RepID=UPI002C2CB868|nr:DUF2752 domain-containing protein [Agriterribacter sp.]HRO45099.1 DUF2752 domain-containing protein [Agriterribacter sp.]HRQ15460.1 DUF2752 domain-containing protein [Agriterribacter sp.]
MITHLIALHIWVQWLEAHMLICPSVKYWGMICPGCGMQRSLIALLKGDFLSSLLLYPALLPLIILIAYALLHLKYKFTGGAKNIIVMQVVVVSIITAHYIYKIYTHQIFL